MKKSELIIQRLNKEFNTGFTKYAKYRRTYAGTWQLAAGSWRGCIVDRKNRNGYREVGFYTSLKGILKSKEIILYKEYVGGWEQWVVESK